MCPNNKLINETDDLSVTLSDYLYKLIPAIKKCAGHYQSGQINEGSNLLLNMIEGLHWVVSVMAKTGLQDYNIGEINLKLNEVVEAFENKDFILVGDLLEYEILPVMEAFLHKLPESYN
ncbi:hypothetical protein ACOBQJ_07180 [Pelotomaculum propionicicum]|uniref:hypothetical protein n=1 Tax=Pelotomaculum propionicicum TaxID=258475 RepID=UPI003B81E190